MESSSQIASKMLEALSPALSAELDRILQGVHREQEEEFRNRLEAAVREAESVTLRAAEQQRERAVAEVREKVSADLKGQFDQTLQQTTTEMQAKLAEQARAAEAQRNADKAKGEAETGKWEGEKAKWEADRANWEADKAKWDVEKTASASEKANLQEQLSLWRTYAEAQSQLAESGSQAEILTRFLNLAESFAGSVAVYVAKADGLALWKARGKGAFADLVSKDTSDPESYFKPIAVRGRTVVGVSAHPPFKIEPLDFLSASLGRAIEAFGMKLENPAPKPVVAAAAAAGAGSSASAPSPAASGAASPLEKLASEARLAARLLVSEIKLYNEQAVRDGRASSDLYVRLRKQIETGREQYRQRVNGSILASRDYYHEELVRVLADGETSRLGGNYPGPMTS